MRKYLENYEKYKNMKVIRLNTNPNLYSSNSYLILGTWNKLEDVNALVDTGSDDYIINEIERTNKGVGKRPLEKVLLTHTHFDHIGALKELKKKYSAEVLSYIKVPGVDRLLTDNEMIRLGDDYFQIIHSPGHSSDSICIYCAGEKILFTGDTSIRVYSKDSTYTDEYIETIEKLAKLKVNIVYPGHGEPISENPQSIIANTLSILKGNSVYQ
jgi:glyoxylase-like metal-dependent hydrolase (beta-lactamase superfamily II)